MALASGVPTGGGSRFVLNALGMKYALSSDDGAVARELLKIVRKVEGEAKRNCPVDTGRLRSSITSTLGKDEEGVYGVAGTDVEYAPHVEFGTYRMNAQSFLRRALDDVGRSL